MIGLPGETDADVIGIADTIRWLQRECRGKGRKGMNFNLTISNFTPKPHTPFQWHSVSTSEFERKQDLLRNELRHERGLKTNYTDVRISAMEDFVGRGDRLLAPVIKRAWELGAGMDSWWENLDKAYGAWQQAIAEAGLTGKYRQVESGGWPGREDVLEAPLPWDHLDTGIDKQWLKEDLKKALAEATVPDCSFEGCSHCGVCGTDFGHNVVVPPPPIPDFLGHFQPDTNKVQRLRARFGKLGEMKLVSHLDLVRLFDRAVRRASLPVSFSGGFHPAPRIMIANALSLGYASTGEIIEFEMKTAVSPSEFQQRLAAELNKDMPLYSVEEIPLQSPAATQLIHRAEYRLTVIADGSVAPEQWQNWAEAVQQSTEILQTQTTKSGKIREVNLRERLYELELLPVTNAAELELRYVGSCANDGTLLRPEQLVFMLEQFAGMELRMINVVRSKLILAE
jgi:radical SAM-linked protein